MVQFLWRSLKCGAWWAACGLAVVGSYVSAAGVGSRLGVLGGAVTAKTPCTASGTNQHWCGTKQNATTTCPNTATYSQCVFVGFPRKTHCQNYAGGISAGCNKWRACVPVNNVKTTTKCNSVKS